MAMREGECRTTKNGRRYCMRGGRVRFQKKGAAAPKKRKAARRKK